MYVPMHESSHSLVLNALAGAGFVALVGGGMWLAVYTTRYVPDVAAHLGSAAVYLGSVFTPASEQSSLSIVPAPVASTTISLGGTSTSGTTTTLPSTPSKPVATTPGNKTNATIQIGNATTTPTLSGLPDLVVTINVIGYLATTSAESFVASTTVPSGGRPAVNFTIRNAGSNVSGSWRWSASIPTQTSYIYMSQPQQSLAPGDSIDYTLGFDQANPGANQPVSISANFDRAVSESNTNNNNASATFLIIGS